MNVSDLFSKERMSAVEIFLGPDHMAIFTAFNFVLRDIVWQFLIYRDGIIFPLINRNFHCQ